ncbi:IS5 family transposase [Streptomyces sp. NPDC056390]|uniref:IS5 family transposase n=1 Tax=Streptomyces sp. NPDC056390 TaxID=3345806 RepID=UPI0035D7D01B
MRAARIEPLLADRTPKRGGRWRDHREVIDAVAWKFQTGSQWVHLPEKYGNWRGVYNRLRMWPVDGTWERVFTALMAQADADEDLNWAVSVDSTIVHAHQHVAGARKRAPGGEPDDHAIGRSRGGLTTKIHLACDGKGRPLAILLTPGQHHDSICARPLLERIRVQRTGLGRPRSKPDQVIADKAYSSRRFRAYLRKRGIACAIPEKADQLRHRHHRGSREGRPPTFDRQIYGRRNVVERCFNRLKGFRGIATRYDKTATSYEAAVSLASFLLWARSV